MTLYQSMYFSVFFLFVFTVVQLLTVSDFFEGINSQASSVENTLTLLQTIVVVRTFK